MRPSELGTCPLLALHHAQRSINCWRYSSICNVRIKDQHGRLGLACLCLGTCNEKAYSGDLQFGICQSDPALFHTGPVLKGCPSL